MAIVPRLVVLDKGAAATVVWGMTGVRSEFAIAS